MQAITVGRGRSIPDRVATKCWQVAHKVPSMTPKPDMCETARTAPRPSARSSARRAWPVAAGRTLRSAALLAIATVGLTGPVEARPSKPAASATIHVSVSVAPRYSLVPNAAGFCLATNSSSPGMPVMRALAAQPLEDSRTSVVELGLCGPHQIGPLARPLPAAAGRPRQLMLVRPE